MEEKHRGPSGTIYLSDGRLDLALISTDKYPCGINHFGFKIDSLEAIEESAPLSRKKIPLELLWKVGSAILKVTRLPLPTPARKKIFKEDGARKVSNGAARSDLGFSVGVSMPSSSYLFCEGEKSQFTKGNVREVLYVYSERVNKV